MSFVLPAWLKEQPVAHRGYHCRDGSGPPENSLAAFEAAIKRGYAIELDVRLSSDGQVIVFHDSTFDRLTGREGEVHRHTAAEMSTMTISGSSETIPSLKKVLALVDGRVPILLELKGLGPEHVGPLEEAVLSLLRRYDGPVAVQSFNPYSMGWFAVHAPMIPRGQISESFIGEKVDWYHAYLLRNLLLNSVSKPHFIAYDVRSLDHWAPQQARSSGLPLLTWTVKDDAQLARARTLADNIIFEDFAA